MNCLSLVHRFDHGLTPAVVARAGERAERRFWEFFTAGIRNPNTRAAYARAAWRFLDWLEVRRLPLAAVEPITVAAYLEELGRTVSPPTVKQHLAALRMLLDYLVAGQILPFNPAAAVRGPKYVVRTGKTPVLTPAEARQLLDSIDVSHVVGRRDRALIGLMVFSFARVSAALKMRVKDYYCQGPRAFIRLVEKGGKYHVVPAHHQVRDLLESYLEAAGIAGDRDGPLFRASDRTRAKRLHPGGLGLSRFGALQLIKRRARAAGLPPEICCHTFRATGITAFLLGGGDVETAARIAAHESPRTTSLYDRRSQEVELAEIERIRI